MKSISPCRKESSHLIKNKFHLECFLPNCDEISQVVKGRKLGIWKVYILDNQWSEKLTWTFSSGDLNESGLNWNRYNSYFWDHAWQTYIWSPIPCSFLNKGHYSALSTSSSRSGTSLWTRIPRFIFAGSKAQLEIPMNATCKCQRFMMNKPFCSQATDWHDFRFLLFYALRVFHLLGNHLLIVDVMSKLHF